MPGCGKSTVGRLLSRQLGTRLVDTDQEAERRMGMTIRVCFETLGESAFRDVEQAVIEDVTREQGVVIATGGGAVLREANREALHGRTRVFYLRSTPEDLVKRLRHDTQRPLLQVADPMRRLRELYRDRDPLYRRTAHFTVDNARPSVQGLVHRVLMQLELSGAVDPDTVPSPVDPLARSSPG